MTILQVFVPIVGEEIIQHPAILFVATQIAALIYTALLFRKSIGLEIYRNKTLVYRHFRGSLLIKAAYYVCQMLVIIWVYPRGESDINFALYATIYYPVMFMFTFGTYLSVRSTYFIQKYIDGKSHKEIHNINIKDKYKF